MSDILSAFEKLTSEKQKKVLNAAADVFAEEGYHYASISEICKRAEISNGALYKYFKNKESLFIAVLDDGVKQVENDLYKKNMLRFTSVYRTVRAILESMGRFSEEKPAMLKIYSDLGSSAMNRFAAVASEKYRNSTSTYTVKLVELGKSNGEIRSGISHPVAACLIDSYITLFAYTLVSQYHINRFDSFYHSGESPMEQPQRINLVVESIKSALS